MIRKIQLVKGDFLYVSIVYGHNFLMRYPDDFGVIIKKLALDLTYIILKFEVSVSYIIQDIDTLRIFLIW